MSVTKGKMAVVALLGLGALGPAVGRFAGRSVAAAPAPGVIKPAADGNEAAASRDEASAAARDALQTVVDFGGFDDPKTTVVEALDALGKIYNVRFDINDKAFAADNVKEVLKYEIAAPNPVPPMKAPLGMVLAKVLARIPNESGTAVMIRKGTLEITTKKAIKAELGIAEHRPLLPLVYEDFEDKSLAAALRTLATASGYSVVLDRKAAGDKAAKVTAGLHNVPVDTAVKVLADMADLGVVRLDNVFYVTSREKAARLQAEQPPPAPVRPAVPPAAPKPAAEPSPKETPKAG